MTLVADQFKFVSSNDRYYSLVVHDPLLFSGYFVYLSLLYLLKVFYLPLIREIKVNLLDILFSRRVFRCRMVLKNKVDIERKILDWRTNWKIPEKRVCAILIYTFFKRFYMRISSTDMYYCKLMVATTKDNKFGDLS